MIRDKPTNGRTNKISGQPYGQTIPIVFASKCHVSRSDASTKPVTAVSNVSNSMTGSNDKYLRVKARRREAIKAIRNFSDRQFLRSRLHCLRLFSAQLRSENGVVSARWKITPLTCTFLEIGDKGVSFNPIYVEAARVFAQNILLHKGDWNARVDWAFERAAGRTPVAEERDALSALYGSTHS